MAQFWQKYGEQWIIHELPPKGARLLDDPSRPVAGLNEGDSPAAMVLAFKSGAQARWGLLCDSGVRVNGDPLSLGIRVLRHQDALRIGTDTELFFSGEQLARISTYEGEPTSCARCSGELIAGQSVVVCPICAAIHHQTTDLSCWTYAPKCAICSQPTPLDVGYAWTPEDL